MDTDTIIDFPKIKAAAEEAGLSARAIARKAGGISHAAVNDILKGDSNPGAISIKKICDVVGLSVDEVFIVKEAA